MRELETLRWRCLRERGKKGETQQSLHVRAPLVLPPHEGARPPRARFSGTAPESPGAKMGIFRNMTGGLAVRKVEAPVKFQRRSLLHAA